MDVIARVTSKDVASKEAASKHEPSEHEISEQLSRALGNAVVRLWSYLPHDVQYHLFEDVINHQDEAMRPRLAVLLHDSHWRTSAGKKARAMLEPDSLGG